MTNSLSQQAKILPTWIQEWGVILLGLIVLYVPTYYTLSTSLWNDEDQAQGPLVLLVVLFLFWQNREQLQNSLLSRTKPVLGGLIFGVGLLSYALGRSQEILILEIGSQIPVLAGIFLLTRGISVLKAMWFPLFFIFFMIPLPSFIVDPITLPMKIAVSYVTDDVLYWLGYPIARMGVILQIGQYQLMVADACAGLHTLISLEALGLLYLNLAKHDSVFRNIVLALLIVPISFTANVIRVIMLTLITYYFGDEVGQGFLHKFAGLVLFMVALILIMGMDSLLQYSVKRWRTHRIINVT